MKRYSFAAGASTGLNWAIDTDRANIAHNLRMASEVLAGEVLRAPGCERLPILHDLQRVFTRLAVCDSVAARVTERELERQRQRDNLCRITLEKMADMFDEASDTRDLQHRNAYVTAAMAFSRLIRDEGLQAWFDTGPYVGLSMVSRLVAAADRQTLHANVDELQDLCWKARSIPLHDTVRGNHAACRTFTDGYVSCRENMRGNESHEM